MRKLVLILLLPLLLQACSVNNTPATHEPLQIVVVHNMTHTPVYAGQTLILAESARVPVGMTLNAPECGASYTVTDSIPYLYITKITSDGGFVIW